MTAQLTSSSSSCTEYGLRKTTRYITGLGPSGESVTLFSPDLRFHDRGGYAITRLYGLENVPANLNDDKDLNDYLSMDGHNNTTTAPATSQSSFQLVTPGGANFVQGDFGPSSCSVWHRTISVDFVTVVEGELVLEVGEDSEDCTKILLKAGDSIVQRGTLHKWVNPSSDNPARFVATLLASNPFKLGETVVRPVWIPKE
ncbi:hypothetical protein BGW36DRAFT_442084 [Talaromyces proteolyticus]|uniref:Cupin type-2 domain-containing protein n=1 Tax=Talaromyces proteolyticus TaxID=1131652 RepID=A0AAD4KE86_9EURO|nr:uncharacterized protein BGW36DRAFT_442084 [Talaromyces proteolyticus]KAH8688965.1 hypothetical protein BGW36DRAFT_442084 [Talaromyces proteolyticus]